MNDRATVDAVDAARFTFGVAAPIGLLATSVPRLDGSSGVVHLDLKSGTIRGRGYGVHRTWVRLDEKGRPSHIQSGQSVRGLADPDQVRVDRRFRGLRFLNHASSPPRVCQVKVHNVVVGINPYAGESVGTATFADIAQSPCNCSQRVQQRGLRCWGHRPDLDIGQHLPRSPDRSG